MIEIHKRIALTEDLPQYGLKSGDIATVVDVHTSPAGYELEFFRLDGTTLAVVSAFQHQVRELGKQDVAQARRLEVA